MSKSDSILGSNGSFDSQYPWFRVRGCQLEMAAAVESAIADQQVLIAESGTGTGKTFAYLVPCLLSKKTTIISTRTKNLQQQLFLHDIPLVCEALNLNLNVRLLKGRENYFCIKRYEMATEQQDLLGQNKKLDYVFDWVQVHNDGDISEYSNLPYELRRKVTSTADNCIGTDCEHWNSCFVNRSRQLAKEADVLVVNHALLCAYMMHGNLDEVHPAAQVIVIDEAHRFPEIAANALGITVTSHQLQQLCLDLADANVAGDFPAEWTQNFCNAIDSLISRILKSVSLKSGRKALHEISSNEKFLKLLEELGEFLGSFQSKLQEYEQANKVIEKLNRRIAEIPEEISLLINRQHEDAASWYEASSKGFNITQIPLELGDEFAKIVSENDWSLIFTSATLAVGKDFSFFLEQIGLQQEAVTIQWPSPFDFQKQSLLYIPASMPPPKHGNIFFDHVAQVIAEVADITSGRAFVLFTSYESLNYVYEKIKSQLDYTLLRQGAGTSSANLLERFKEEDHAVLFGTSSFWEGVDVKGSALSCVIIVKLPFAVPTDPLMEARAKKMQARGENVFTKWQVPQAALTLKQGAGRLIRDVDDTGILVICDPRISFMRYGKQFLSSLPPMRRTSNTDDLKSFMSA